MGKPCSAVCDKALYASSFRGNAHGFAFQQGSSNLLVSASDDVAEGLAGNAHLHRGIGLVKTFQISQSQSFDLIEFKLDLIERAQRNSLGLEVSRSDIAGHLATFEGPAHQQADAAVQGLSLGARASIPPPSMTRL